MTDPAEQPCRDEDRGASRAGLPPGGQQPQPETITPG